MASSTYPYNPSKEIPPLDNKVILITGGTAGIGTEFILQFAKHNPARIYFTGRNETSAKKVITSAKAINANLDIHFLQCDFTSLKSVQAAAQKFASSNTRLDILMCNAGIMMTPPGTTADGYELQMGVNHIAHALLIKALLPLLQHTSTLPNTTTRIVLTSSLAATNPMGGIRFADLKTAQDWGAMGPMMRYAQSKLANVLYAKQLAVHYPSITSVSIHPGIFKSGLWQVHRRIDRAVLQLTTFWRQVSVEDGAKNGLWCATVGEGEVENGAFYEPVGRRGEESRFMRDEGLAGELWEWTERELEAWG
ncbi:oxidoreductase [Polyplosphaeria fusca]|uniref:Oxidoreductase n=1 Tax=Polyplosphaeria fusca TaxID=682080 RepID=A0A9P4QLG6_9PLEO|nr:oxidoreductase [Polyplosphaeria fusca]